MHEYLSKKAFVYKGKVLLIPFLCTMRQNFKSSARYEFKLFNTGRRCIVCTYWGNIGKICQNIWIWEKGNIKVFPIVKLVRNPLLGLPTGLQATVKYTSTNISTLSYLEILKICSSKRSHFHIQKLFWMDHLMTLLGNLLNLCRNHIKS